MPSGGNFSSCNCGPDVSACDSPTQPVATVGLCLADGSPIAVTVVRDCAGTVTSEGWIDLTTGGWSSGAPPAGTVACGDSRSITTNGTFCDVLEDGTVAGLVLVEYQYAADGSIASVRLVDAVTGTTYTPQGEVTTCPAGVEAPERDMLQLCDTTDDESGAITSVPFLRDYARDESGTIVGHTDYTLDGDPYTPSGTVGVCGPQTEPVEPCASTVTVLRLCDLNPDAPPDDEGKRCAIPFLRHLVHDCTGALTETRDTTTDGTTPYTPVEAVDCGSGGVPAMVEVPWEVVDIQPDPASPVGRGLIYTLSPIDDPATVGTVTVTTTATANTACPGTPPSYNFRNPCTYTFEPDQALQDAATYVRCDLIDFDTFEPVTSLNPPPSRLGGTAYWDGTTIRPTESNGTGEMYYDGPPASWSYRVGNTGGGNSCSSLSFAAVSLRPEGCCAPCGSSGGGDGSGRTVQEVCVIANSAPTEVMTWTRVIEDGGATIYYLDQDGARYDDTLPAGHQIIACPVEPEPCRDNSSTLLCDTSAADLITVFDPANRPDDDGWEVVSFTGYHADAPPEAPLPYPARYGTPYGYPALGARADQYGGYGGGSWQGYDSAPVRWVLRKTFTAPEDGVAIAQSIGFRGDGGARVRINGIDAGMYGQWNQPATSGTAEIPVTAGANTVEIEVRDVNGVNNVVGRLDIALPKTVQFMRRQTVDCETGDVISTTDTTLDGEPYEVTGEVGQCTPTSECCEQPPPELRVDVESDVMCIRDEDGEITGQVVVERVYDDQSGDRVVQRLTDPTTGDEVTLPDGAELVLCQDPPCPTAFSTECVGAVTRTEAGYDNTSLIGGVPGKCGSVQGPNGQFPCQPTSGGYTIISWIVDGEEVIGEGGGRDFAGGPCGEGTAGNLGMHHNWALALTNLDPSGANWSAQEAEGCAWFVGSTGGTTTVYGPMTVVDAEGRQWILGPAQACEETQFTKVYSQQCDGSVTVSWLDAQGVETDAPEGDLVPCGTGCGTGGGAGLDIELVELCDVQADGTAVPFLRHITYGSAGQVATVVDTALDAFAPYAPTGTVSRCQDDREPGVDVETLRMCVIDDATGNPLQEVLAELRYDTETGERIGVNYVDPLTWGPVAIPGGAHFGLCPDQGPAPDVELLSLCDVAEDGTSTPFLRHLVYQVGASTPTVLDTLLDGATPYTVAGTVGTCAPEECPLRDVVTACRCDDTDGDGIADLDYVELMGVDCEGQLTSLGTYLPDLSASYTPVAPVDCTESGDGADPVVTVQARRVELTAGATWNAAGFPTLQSVTVVGHGGTGTITTADGTSTLHAGETVTWSVARDQDAALAGPLSVAATSGTVTVSFTVATTA